MGIIVVETAVQGWVEHPTAAETNVLLLELAAYDQAPKITAVLKRTEDSDDSLRNDMWQLGEFPMLTLTERMSWLATLVSYVSKQQLTESDFIRVSSSKQESSERLTH